MDFSTSPNTNIENSPAETFISTPGETYSSLFSVSTVSTPAATNTMNPMEMMTPESFSEDKASVASPSSPSASPAPESESNPDNSDKKTTKKRKSWGQVLPEPKTNLPPRKRAKTEDEKEQRRVERVLRNRRAAQSSRERKRLEVEALESHNKTLQEKLNQAEKANMLLAQELERYRRDSGVVTRSSSPLDSLRDNPALSQQLFSSQSALDGATVDNSTPLMDDILASSNTTVNPASLSPELAAIPEVLEPSTAPEKASKDVKTKKTTSTASPDLTQRPAEMLCDLQCQVSAEPSRAFMISQTSMPQAWLLALQLRMMLLSASAMALTCHRPLMQIAMSWKAGFSLLPTPRVLTTIIWLVTLPRSTTSTTSTSTTSSPTTQTTLLRNLWERAIISSQQTTVSTSARSSTLRLKSLRKILSSSPSLARPLLDATLVALRLVSERRENRVETSRIESDGTRGNDCELTRCLRGIDLPSMELLMTLSWTLKVYEKRRMEAQRRRSNTILDSEDVVARHQQQQPTRNIMKKGGEKRKRTDVGSIPILKRGRMS